ncbi:hypothetical protein IWW55_003003 [Coemansia sp. RSA 2706]|nr:hypothetical protein IWW55_003003 [Coemansia sp. RSA 2706]KAJ2387716.1 hypothetical protein H4S02_003226 [Coemansia sp. RSA 2611]
MNPITINTGYELGHFMANKCAVVFFTKSATGELPEVKSDALSDKQRTETVFGQIRGEELYAVLGSRIPLKSDAGVAIFKNSILQHQLEGATLAYFEQCIKDVHTATTLPPCSPTLSFTMDMYTQRSSSESPLILPASVKSLDMNDYAMRRTSTATINSNVSTDVFAARSKPIDAIVAEPTPVTKAQAPRRQQPSQDEAACCIIM